MLRIQFVGVLKVGFCALAVSQLDVENAAGQVELRRSRLHAHAIAYYVNANFERLVCPAHAGKLELQIHVFWIEQDGLSQGADRARSIPRVLVCGGSQLQGARVSILAWRSGSRVAARRGDAKAVSLSDHPPDTRSDLSTCWKASRACLLSPLEANAIPCKDQSCAFLGVCCKAARQSSMARSKSWALSAEVMGSTSTL
ncbi:MAG: hypothetical protein DMG70_29900 [Acidobacteria bacterium]|nr:MAG: hypothetical protein DMG70_29900 [Acidobacteriota bacterium]